MKGSPSFSEAICNTTQLLMWSIKKVEEEKTKAVISTWNSSVEEKWKKGGGRIRRAEEGAIRWFLSFFCSFALLFLSLVLIKCSGAVSCTDCESTHTHYCREALLGGNFFCLWPWKWQGPHSEKELMTRFVLHLAPLHREFSETPAIKFNSLENA